MKFVMCSALVSVEPVAASVGRPISAPRCRIGHRTGIAARRVWHNVSPEVPSDVPIPPEFSAIVPRHPRFLSLSSIRTRPVMVGACLAGILAFRLGAAELSPALAGAENTFKGEILPFVEKNCYGCKVDHS